MPDLTREELEEYKQRLKELGIPTEGLTRLNFFPGVDPDEDLRFPDYVYDPKSEYRRKVMDELVQVAVELHKSRSSGQVSFDEPPRTNKEPTDIREWLKTRI
jgi:hypothetical protein